MLILSSWPLLVTDWGCSTVAERYLRLDPSGAISWISIDRVPYEFDPSIEGLSLDQVYAAIGCSCIEQVSTIIPGIVILIDESGKMKTPPQAHNELASRLYAGYLYGLDNIVGPAIVCAMRLTSPIGEYDLFPLYHRELSQLSSILGVHLPE